MLCRTLLQPDSRIEPSELCRARGEYAGENPRDTPEDIASRTPSSVQPGKSVHRVRELIARGLLREVDSPGEIGSHVSPPTSIMRISIDQTSLVEIFDPSPDELVGAI